MAITLKQNTMNLSTYRRAAVLWIMAILVSFTCMAQGPRVEKVRALKAAYITEKLNLTSAQSERFWPVYHRYEEELMSTRQKYIKQNRKDAKTEEEAKRMIEGNLDFQEAAVDIRRKYKTEFLKIISAQQLADLYTSEREFRQMLMQKLKEKRGRRGRN